MTLLTLIQQPTLRLLLLAAAVASAAMLGAALIAQYGFELYPCHLCIYQRYPYAAIAVLGLVAALFCNPPPWQRLAAWICVLLFLTDAGIAFYHAGVELGWFPGPSGCTNNPTASQTLEELRAQIMNAPLVPCDQAMAHIFGLSLAAWNALAAFVFAVLMALGLKRVSHGG